MRRIPMMPRPNWQQKVEKWGLTFHTENGNPYWTENACYQFTSREIEVLESTTNELHRLCLEAVDYVIQNRLYSEFGIPPHVAPIIEWAWENEPPTLYGRFDLVFDGSATPKLLEYNADTPTSLLEAAVIQWKWLEEIAPQRDQFNGIWEALVNQWTWLLQERKILGSLVHFGYSDLIEDELTITVLRDTAQEAGIETSALLMEEIGWDEQNNWFVDLNGIRIWTLFKLYPWEWIVHEEFGKHVLGTMRDCQWIEPIWKMILSNKALLPILHQLNPGHPSILPAYFDGPHGMLEYVVKPKLGREGQNVTIVSSLHAEQTGGEYGTEGFVYQQYVPLPDFQGNHPVIGSWVIGESSAGIGIRETSHRITDNLARFVPHWFE